MSRQLAQRGSAPRPDPGLSGRGFTLIELVVAVAIVAILAVVAYPAYTDSVRKARRADGTATLLDIAARLERFRTASNTYTTSLAALGHPDSSPEGYYGISIAAGGAGIATSFVITATAQGAQDSDSHCATLTYASTGAKGGTNTDCW